MLDLQPICKSSGIKQYKDSYELMFSHISNKDLSLEDSLIVDFSEVLLQMVVVL